MLDIEEHLLSKLARLSFKILRTRPRVTTKQAAMCQSYGSDLSGSQRVTYLVGDLGPASSIDSVRHEEERCRENQQS